MSLGFSTRAIHNGEEPDFREGASGDVAVPIHLSTTFARLKAEALRRGTNIPAVLTLPERHWRRNWPHWTVLSMVWLFRLV